jgi:hypothetical protein
MAPASPPRNGGLVNDHDWRSRADGVLGTHPGFRCLACDAVHLFHDTIAVAAREWSSTYSSTPRYECSALHQSSVGSWLYLRARNASWAAQAPCNTSIICMTSPGCQTAGRVTKQKVRGAGLLYSTVSVSGSNVSTPVDTSSYVTGDENKIIALIVACMHRVVYYSLRPYLFVVIGVRTKSLTRFVENTCNICSSNNFIKKLDSNIFPMILIMYHKY